MSLGIHKGQARLSTTKSFLCPSQAHCMPLVANLCPCIGEPPSLKAVAYRRHMKCLYALYVASDAHPGNGKGVELLLHIGVYGRLPRRICSFLGNGRIEKTCDEWNDATCHSEIAGPKGWIWAAHIMQAQEAKERCCTTCNSHAFV